MRGDLVGQAFWAVGMAKDSTKVVSFGEFVQIKARRDGNGRKDERAHYPQQQPALPWPLTA
jgi:hypothetical protein